MSPSAKGKILSADWIKLSTPPIPPLLKLQNIIKTIIFRRFGSTIHFPVFAKLSEKHNFIIFADFRCASAPAL
jgi:hypothetical protein